LPSVTVKNQLFANYNGPRTVSTPFLSLFTELHGFVGQTSKAAHSKGPTKPWLGGRCASKSYGLLVIHQLSADAARFGQNYLSKLGWDPSKGLGIAGNGRTDHIKVIQKQDTLGIGVSRGRELDGTAWKQNTDFEDLLKRLNETTAGTCEDVGVKETRDEGNVEKGRTMEEEDGTSKPRKKKRKMTEPEGSSSKPSERRKEKETVKISLDAPSSVPTKPASAKIIPRRAYVHLDLTASQHYINSPF
jgi:hypothetical protein